MIKKGFSHIIISILYLLSLLPLSVLHVFARLLYYFIYYLIRYRRRVVRGNLVRSFPDRSLPEIIDMEKKFYKHLTDLIFEIIKMSSISEKELMKRVTFKDLDLLNQYLSKGQSVLACTGHYGNWELCVMGLNKKVLGTPYVIYKPLANENFEKWFYRIRTRFGNVLVTMRKTLRTVVATKDIPTVFCFASDQTPVREEIQYTLSFLNQPTAVLLGLEKIALQTNRPVFYFEITTTKRGYFTVSCSPLCLDPSGTKGHEITDRFFEMLTSSINKEPSQWLWSHRRWKLNG